jgi:hypothetical protein
MQILKNTLFTFSLLFVVNAQVIDDNNAPRPGDDNNVPRPGDDRPLPPGPQVPVVTSTSSVSTSVSTSTLKPIPTNGAKNNGVGTLGLVSFLAYAAL